MDAQRLLDTLNQVHRDRLIEPSPPYAQYILPFGDYIDTLVLRSTYFARVHSLLPLTELMANGVVQGLIQQCFFNRLYWTDTADHLDRALSRFVPWWATTGGLTTGSETPESRLATRFYEDVIDTVEIELSHLADQVIGLPNTDAMWRIWYTSHYDRDLILEHGEDFRIQEFRRLVQLGLVDLPLSARARL